MQGKYQPSIRLVKFLKGIFGHVYSFTGFCQYYPYMGSSVAKIVSPWIYFESSFRHLMALTDTVPASHPFVTDLKIPYMKDLELEELDWRVPVDENSDLVLLLERALQNMNGERTAKAFDVTKVSEGFGRFRRDETRMLKVTGSLLQALVNAAMTEGEPSDQQVADAIGETYAVLTRSCGWKRNRDASRKRAYGLKNRSGKRPNRKPAVG